jgi:hypothetical protein
MLESFTPRRLESVFSPRRIPRLVHKMSCGTSGPFCPVERRSQNLANRDATRGPGLPLRFPFRAASECMRHRMQTTRGLKDRRRVDPRPIGRPARQLCF